jgi:predicted NAD/FAD-binding protein
MLLDVSRFRKEAGEVLIDPKYKDYSLSRYIYEKKYSEDFLKKFLIPMSSAVWSAPFDAMLQFPAATLIRFFKNHCFLDLKGQLQWRTCVNGSRVYRDKIMAIVKPKILLNTPVKEVRRVLKKVEVVDSTGQKALFDHVLLASHADESLKVLTDASAMERDLLSQFPYQLNRGILHTDEALMPRLKQVWSAWNYRVEQSGDCSTIYWMNQLQGVSKKQNYFISINDPGVVRPSKILWEGYYSHPVYSVVSQELQSELHKLNENGQVFFAGAYFRYGFHEDGLWSGLQAARALTREKLWG